MQVPNQIPPHPPLQAEHDCITTEASACRTLAAGSPRSQAYAGTSGARPRAVRHAGELEEADALVRREPLARTRGPIAPCRASARARVLVRFEAETSSTLRLRTVSGCRPAGC